MLSLFFDSGLVAALGIGVLLLEGLWWWRCRARIPYGFLASGALLLVALGLALRDASAPWIGLAMAAALMAHIYDVKSR